MAPPWIQLLEYIRNGEAVDARTDNRVLQQLAQRTDYLKAIIDALSGVKGTFDLDAAVAPDVQEGYAVYWNAANLRYENALAAFDNSDLSLYWNIADSAYCVGVCVSKSNTVRGTIMFGGFAETVNFNNAVGGAIVPGPYFLSATEPGKMVKQRPPVGIIVMFGAQSHGVSSGDAIIMPTPRELLENHIHYKLVLQYGTEVGDPGWTNILDPNIAPVGARFRYTEENDAPVDALFPLYPPESVYFEIDGIGANEKIIVDMNGIWWIDPTYDPDQFREMIIWYTRMTAITNSSMVTSLRSLSDAIKILNCNGQPATSGDLYAKLELVLSQGGDTDPGYLAFKRLTDGGQFVRGPIVESLKSLSPEISVAFETASGMTDVDGRKYGRLLLSFNDPSNISQEGRPSLVSLDNAVQEDYNGLVPYMGMPYGLESSIQYQFDVPLSGLSGAYKFYFNAWLFAAANGVLPTLECDYTIIQKAENTALHNMSENVTGSADLSIPLPNVNTNDYCLATLLPNTGLTVAPGDQVLIRVKRNDSSYGGVVGIMRAFFTMTKVT